MSTAYIFPGQGAQAVGMGLPLVEAFATARQVFEEIDEALGEKLSALIFAGPAEDLTLTANTQPALFAVSMAVLRTLERDFGVTAPPAFVAGHSLGEYSALAAAGSLSLADGARVLRRRGTAMQAAVPPDVGAMAALIGKVTVEVAEAIAEAGQAAGVVTVANDNNVGNVVISGEAAAVRAALDAAKAQGIRGVMLQVSAPFHCPLMAPAADAMAPALAEVALAPLASPLVANVTARPTQVPSEIRALLLEQITGRVRWRESCAFLHETAGVQTFVEIGAGKMLSGMVKRTCPEAEVLSLEQPADLEAYAKRR
jgi:[acyl-carrier-protein] S-malonyltransferase